MEVDRRRARLLLAALALTFLVLRTFLHLWPSTNLNVGPYNVHHLFIGLLLVTVAGIPLALTRGGGRRLDVAVVVFGVGLSMALDEWVYLITTDGSDASYLLPISLWSAAVMIGLACAYVLALMGRAKASPLVVTALLASTASASSNLDARVKSFLDGARGQWRDMNVPYTDGQALHDLIVKKGFKRGVEIGTSTGHSAIWIGWAMSKTGGKLITIEIDEGRYRKALENFEAAGVAPYVDARRADAHQLVKELPGPFDFVFSDADKDWYTRYFKDLDPKLAKGGCFTAHNVLDGFAGVDAFLEYVRSRPDYTTTIERTSRSGFSVSCKTR